MRSHAEVLHRSLVVDQRFDRSGQNDPCIVDQNVHRTERAADFGNDALRAFFVRHVARCGHGDPACIPNAAHGLLRVALGEGVYGNARVKRGKTQSSGLPNARARAGDENGLSRKIRHSLRLLNQKEACCKIRVKF